MSNEKLAETIKKLGSIPKRDKQYAYKMGKDCGKNGPTIKNCHFSIFSSRENAEEWQRGLRETKAKKKRGGCDNPC